MKPHPTVFSCLNTRAAVLWACRSLLLTVLVSCGGGSGQSGSAPGSSTSLDTNSPAAPPATATMDPGSPAIPPTPTPPPTNTALQGDWSLASTWANGKVPVDGDVIEIPAGTTVVLNGTTAKLAGLTIHGELKIGDTGSDIGITSRWIMVHGILAAGSEAAPFSKKLTINLTGTDKTQSIMGMGTKLIGVMAGGKLQLHGENRMGWTQLTQSASPGATAINLQDDAGSWRTGDRLVIAPSGFEANEYEVVTVTSVTGKTVNFQPALKHPHWGVVQTYEGKALDQCAAVGLLSRNIVIRGDDASDSASFGGHVMAMQGATTKISGVELSKMGQRGIKGRYPFHWHLAGDLSNGDYFKNNAIHHSFQRAVVVHGTNDALVEGNVAFNISNHAFVWAEDGNEVRNKFLRNLAVFNKNPKESEFAFPILNSLFSNSGQSEFRSASFWGRGFNHTIKGNIAAGSEDGFGFFFDRFSPNIVSETEGIGLVFEDNIAHSNYRPGASGVAAEIYPEATFGHGLMVTASLKETTPHVFKRFTSYKNYGGAWLEDRSTQLQDSIVSDNGTGIYVHRGVIDRVVIVGKSANTLGNAEIPPKGGFGSSAKGAIVVPSSHGGARAPVILDATVINHDDAAFVVDVEDLGYGARVDKLKLVNTPKAAFFHEFNPYEYTFDPHGFEDRLGSLNMGEPTIWAKRRSPLVTAGCQSNVGINAFACPVSSALLLRYKNSPNRTTQLIQTNGSALGLGQPWYFDASLAEAQSINSGWVQNGGRYEVLTQAQDEKPSSIELYLERSEGKRVELSWSTNGAPSSVQQNSAGIPAVSSLNALRGAAASGYFYDAVAKKTHLQIAGAAGTQKIVMAATLVTTEMALLGRAPDAISAPVSGATISKYPGSSPSSQLRQSLPAGGSSEAFAAASLTFASTQGVLGNMGSGSYAFRAYINAPTDGLYFLSAPAVNGNVDVFVGDVWITGSLNNLSTVLQEPSAQARDEAGYIALRKGWHPITVVMGRNERQASYNNFSPRLALRWSLPGSDQHVAIPLFRQP